MESQKAANSTPNMGTDKVKKTKNDQKNEERRRGVSDVFVNTAPKLQHQQTQQHKSHITKPSNLDDIPSFSGGMKSNVSGCETNNQRSAVTTTKSTEPSSKNEETSLEKLHIQILQTKLHLFKLQQKLKQRQQQQNKKMLKNKQQEELLLLNKSIDETKKKLEKMEERQLEIHSSIPGMKEVEISAPGNSLYATAPTPKISCPEIPIHSSRALDATSIIPESSHTDSEMRGSGNIDTNLTLGDVRSENRSQRQAAILKSLIEGLPYPDFGHEAPLCTCRIIIREKKPKTPERPRTFRVDKKIFTKPSQLRRLLDERRRKQQQHRMKKNVKPPAPKQPKIIKKAEDTVDPSLKGKIFFEDEMVTPEKEVKGPKKDTVTPEKEPVKNAPKSIFDFDFDEDDDPLLELRAKIEKEAREKAKLGDDTEKPNNSNKENEQVKFKNDIPEVIQTPEVPKPAIFVQKKRIVKPSKTYEYIIKEDINCPAKKQLIAKAQITEFHLHALHNYYIPNVNGNWSDVIEYPNTNNKNSDDDGSNKVPKYSPTMRNRPPKNNPEIKSSKNYQPNTELLSKRMKESYNIPFLGIARSYIFNKSTEMQIPNEEIIKNITHNDVVGSTPLRKINETPNNRVVNGIERELPISTENRHKRLSRHRDGHVKRKPKLHRQLFHSHELYPVGHNTEKYGHYHEKLFDNISSCSSDCDTCSESDDEDGKFNTWDTPKLKRKVRIAATKFTGTNIIDDNYNDGIKNNKNKASNTATHVINDDSDHNVIIEIDSDNSNDSLTAPNKFELPEHNTGFFESFNKICTDFSVISELDLIKKHITLTEETSTTTSTSTTSTTTTTTATASGNGDNGKKIGDANTASVFTKLSNMSLPEFPFSEDMIKEENRTGKRIVNGNGVQYFKEWDQPVQLRSYNGELLTALPYVIID